MGNEQSIEGNANSTIMQQDDDGRLSPDSLASAAKLIRQLSFEQAITPTSADGVPKTIFPPSSLDNDDDDDDNNNNKNGEEESPSTTPIRGVPFDDVPTPVHSNNIEASENMSENMSVASASTLETYFADAHSEEANILKEDMKRLENDYQLQGQRLKGVETTVKQLRKKIRQMERDQHLLQTRREEESAEMASLRRQSSTVLGLDASLKAAIGEIDRLKKVQTTEEGDRDTELESAQMKVKAMELELSSSQNQILSERKESERIREDLESQLQEMLDKVLGMEQEAKDSSRDNEVTRALEKQLDEAQSEVKRVQEEGNAAIAAQDELRRLKNEAEGQCEAETRKREELEAKLVSTRSQIERLKKAMAHEKLSHEEDEQLLADARVELDTLRKDVAENSSSSELVEQQLMEARSEGRRLEDALSREISAHEVDEQDLVDARTEIGKLKETIEKSQTASDDLTATEQRLQSELVQMQFELNQVRESLEATRDENTKIREEAKIEFDRLEKEVSETNDERERLKVSLSPQMQVTKAVSKAVAPRDQEIKELKQHVAELGQSAKKATDEKNWLQARLKVFKEESKLLEQQKFNMQNELEHELRVARTESSNAKAESQRLHERMESLNKEVDVVNGELEELQGKLGKHRQAKARADAQVSQLEGMVQEIQGQLQSSEAANAELRKELKVASETVATQSELLFRTNGNGGITETAGDESGSTGSPKPTLESVDNDVMNGSASVARRVASDSANEVFHGQANDEHLEPSDNMSPSGRRLGEDSPETFSTPMSEKASPVVQPDRAMPSMPALDLSTSQVSDDSDHTPLKKGRRPTLDSFEEHVHSWPRSWQDNDTKQKYEGRDVTGYGLNPPKPMWPNMAKVALNFTIHFEEGGEMCLLHGDAASEYRLTEIEGAPSLQGQRNPNVESLYEYGSRAGFWRLHRLFTSNSIKPTVFAAGMALERNVQVCHAMKESGWEVSSHGYRMVDYRNVDTKTQIEHMKRTIAIHQKILGDAPVGIHLGSPSPESRKIASQKFYYDSDSYSDELPFWTMENGSPHLVIPHTMTQNDMRFVTPNGFSNGQEFCQYLTETLNTFIQEGREGRPRMMTVALHCRIIGRPGRAQGLSQFMDYAKGLGSDVWICTKEDVARYWYDKYYPMGQGNPVNQKSPVKTKPPPVEAESWLWNPFY